MKKPLVVRIYQAVRGACPEVFEGSLSNYNGGND